VLGPAGGLPGQADGAVEEKLVRSGPDDQERLGYEYVRSAARMRPAKVFKAGAG
jgi:hypothetical protein